MVFKLKASYSVGKPLNTSCGYFIFIVQIKGFYIHSVQKLHLGTLLD